jgi:hypothetical protein
MDAVAQVAEAVLYEGYLLWPYRRSALKNARRWTFGGVYPEAWSWATGGNDASVMQTQCLIEGGAETRIDVTVRFLHVVERRVARAVGEALEFVDELVLGNERHLAWDEAAEREVAVTGLAPSALRVAHRAPILVPPGTATEWVSDGTEARRGAIVRAWRSLAGAVEVGAELLRAGLARLTVRIANTTPWDGGGRDEALRQTFVSTHTILRAARGEFVSLMDPPPALRAAAEECRNTGTWPVLAGAEGDRHTLLSSPIILYDWPHVAPESPGDLFDACEIDQMLVLNMLALTEEEQREMRASDPRARAILERCAGLGPAERGRLHGAVRRFGPAGEG